VLGPGGRSLIVATGRRLVSVDVASGRVRPMYTAPFAIEQLAGPPGRFLAVADREEIAVVDPRSGRWHAVAYGDPSVNGVNGMMSASPQVLLVASTGQSAGRGTLLPRLTALNVFSGARWTVPLGSASEVPSVVYLRVSPDQRTWYVTGSQVDAANNHAVATTWAIDAAARRVRWRATGPAGAFASPVQVSADNRLVAVGYSTGAADVLDAASGRLLVRVSSSSTIASGDLALAAGDKLLVTASLDGLLRTWRVHGSERLRLQAPPGTAVGFSSDGRDLVLLGARGEIVDRRGRVLQAFPGFPAGNVFNYCSACYAATPSLRWLVYPDPASASPRVVELDGLTGRRVADVAAPRLEAEGVAPDGRIVASWVESGRLFAQLIDPRSGRAQTLPSAPSRAGCWATTPSFTPDGRAMAVIDGCVDLSVWDVPGARVERTVMLPQPASGPATIAPGGRYVLVPVPGGGFLRADLRTGRVAQVAGAGAPGEALAVSPDGRFYAVGREDGTVEEYDSRSLRVIRQHTLQDPVRGLAFSPDSRELVVVDTGNVIRVWDTCEACENASALAAIAARDSVRDLSAEELMTYDVPRALAPALPSERRAGR